MPYSHVKLLYVDDDADDYLLLDSQLKRIKDRWYTLHRAASLEEAEELLKESFDLVFVDYRLGKDNGIDLLRLIKRHSPFIPVIMLTGMENSEIDNIALTEGASDYLVKGGFTPHDLERSIRYSLRDARSMKAMETSSRRFRNIFERSADPIILIDQGTTIISANPSFCKLFNYIPAIEEREMPTLSLFLADASSAKWIKHEVQSGKELTDFQVNMVKGPGNHIKTLINIVKHDEEAGVFQAMIKDLTSLKEKEEEEQLFRKFSSTGRIARILAHEIKNPLTNITLSTDQIRFEFEQQQQHDQLYFVDVIERNLKRINELLTQLLNSTKFTELQLAEDNLNDIVLEVLAQAKDSLELAQVTVQTQLSNEDTAIRMDADKVRIAIFNLVVNAIDAMPKGSGVLFISTSVEKDRMVLEITDNGSGITNEQMEKLFEPFYTSKHAGTGLGLTNAQNIMMSHQGLLKVKSTPGAGSSFFMIFNRS